jgi:hypothetical protein
MQHTVMPVRQADGKVKYVYAALDRKRELVASQIEVGNAMSSSDARTRLHERSRKFARHVQGLRSERQRRSLDMRRQTTSLRTGTIKNLVVMLRYDTVAMLVAAACVHRLITLSIIRLTGLQTTPVASFRLKRTSRPYSTTSARIPCARPARCATCGPPTRTAS